jgi:hypothetical protein
MTGDEQRPVIDEKGTFGRITLGVASMADVVRVLVA